VKEVLPYLQNLSAIAFFLLGVPTVVVWLRHRDRSRLFLGMAIVLQSLASLLGRIAVVLHINPRLLAELSTPPLPSGKAVQDGRTRRSSATRC
jgi:hypothetical protein